ncbi:DUF3261 domain-containing protein [Simiduia sp. 21SJ11W-1]|uniref:DUF3261 domain-containing protein n=1 Tax=Simiduia sp. 21SJ11W-1 TaxID=2909669 RepID=UPI00209E02FE|nr:DUF3261 domain-containing protein [Simiduia sp. 21SJ11W-1]UTA48727.1 DUF3261 domain-containing protein [Simiduia sp. 21SJ11W-1]
MRKARLILCALILVASGCQLTRAPAEPVPALLAPSALGHTLQVSQQLAIDSQAGRRNLLVVWSVDAQALQVVGLTAQGRKLFSLRYDGQQLHSEHQVPLPGGFSGERFVRELQWAYWPETDVRQALQAAGWGLQTTANTRVITNPEGLQIKYHFVQGAWPASVRLSHFEHYQMKIDTLSASEVSAPAAGAD